MRIGFLVLCFMMFTMLTLSGAEIVVRPLNIDDWEEFRNLRLKALKEEPKAYGISAEDEAGKADEEWKSMCLDAFHGKGKWFFVAQHEGKLIGMLGATELFGSYMRHQVEICSAFVESSFRRHGVLTELYNGLKRKLEEVPHLEQMIVWVTLHENQFGKHTFEKFGFSFAGTLSRTVKFDDKYYDCCWLEAPLKSPR
jgi:RimJ/RimL family protein N-acetyltransferase